MHDPLQPHTLRPRDRARGHRRRVWLGIGIVLLLVALGGYRCTASPAEQQQQTYWRNKAERELTPGMSQAQVLAWAERNALRTAMGIGPTLMAAPVRTRWPHFPCATTFTMISLTFDARGNLVSFSVGRGGTCL
ncbi:hypothetical protein LMG31884_45300 [Xanthomonas hydrangeae]|nr:hypothetical protein LMG31884_45300 [Xanthomonas hydrangeae]CAD7730775.1 hypothetical protein LMG31884_45300 [Xanthomonas hydrangeae]CAD7745835.1 hypothetical protein LMG31887_45220 [Xanthomonas hydrangeae]CAD7745838.1 hypothetical protein LMG31887_45220 [Xanthomonas hydrangeae]